jgi:glycogen synthase
MKVLMFGWEFPPHISGGLGIACHGLTAALGSDGIKVLFVVPKLQGEEHIKHGKLISASKVIIPTLKNGQPIGSAESSKALVLSNSSEPRQVSFEQSDTITYVSIPSALSPYHQTMREDYSVRVTDWNYSFADKFFASRIYPSEPDQLLETSPGVTYDFSGSYGPALMEEVEKYTVVAQTICRQHSFNIIHAHDWMTFRAGIEAKKISGKPLVVHIHATEFDRAGNNGQRAVYEIEREGMMAADRVVAVSERTKAIAVREYQVPDNKILVVHNGISPVDQGTQNCSVRLGSHIISFLGRITYQKGPLYFVEAARKVLQQFPNAHFVVAGAGDLLPNMVERVAQLRISNNFHFTGFIKKENVERIWSISDVYVMPSVSEPFGITPLEAIQAGVPVIISNQAGVSEVMPHAIKINFWDTGALAEAICSVLKYKSLSRTLKKNSYEEIKNISWSKAANKIKNLYYELTSKNRRHA